MRRDSDLQSGVDEIVVSAWVSPWPQREVDLVPNRLRAQTVRETQSSTRQQKMRRTTG